MTKGEIERVRAMREERERDKKQKHDRERQREIDRVRVAGSELWMPNLPTCPLLETTLLQNLGILGLQSQTERRLALLKNSKD